MVETIPMTMPEIWRRIHNLPDARRLYDQIKLSAAPGGGKSAANTFSHPVLLSNPIQFSQSQRPLPGGIVGLGGNQSMSGLRADPAAPVVLLHEIWLWDEGDYTTIQIIQGAGGDILVAPRLKKANLLVSQGQKSGLHPYSLIQPNSEEGNIWGRSELEDLFELQDWASGTADDIRKLFGVQVDRILAFGGEGLNDESYGQMRAAGWANLGPGGSVNDLTPPFPPQAIPMLDKIIQLIEMISGFDNLLSGKSEGSVRSGVQASPLMKVAGARLKDRSLEVERQCAEAADLRLSLMEYKDGRRYWTDPKKVEETGFLLSDLPEDRRVVVDGHTSSPVFADEHQGLVINGVKLGLVDKISAIESLPFQNKDVIVRRHQEAEERQAANLQQLKQTDPEGFAKAMEKAISSRRGR
jgi:hypothetical protein